MVAGAAGVHGLPAVDERGRGVDSVITQHPAMEAWHAEDYSKSLQNAFKICSTAPDERFIKTSLEIEV